MKIKNTFENQEFFFKGIAKNDETFQKRRFFFWFKKLKKQKNWRCKKATKKVQKKREQIKNTCTQKERKMEQEKTCVQKRKAKKTNWKREKKKGRWKTEVFKKNQRRRQTGGEKQEENKVKEEKRFVRREKRRLFNKEAKKHSFSQTLNSIRKNENIICPKREDTFFFQRKGFSLKIKTEKTCLVFFFFWRKEKCFNMFPFFWREKIHTQKTEEEKQKQILKIENWLKWKRARDKKNKLCQDFFRSRQKEKQ